MSGRSRCQSSAALTRLTTTWKCYGKFHGKCHGKYPNTCWLTEEGDKGKLFSQADKQRTPLPSGTTLPQDLWNLQTSALIIKSICEQHTSFWVVKYVYFSKPPFSFFFFKALNSIKCQVLTRWSTSKGCKQVPLLPVDPVSKTCCLLERSSNESSLRSLPISAWGRSLLARKLGLVLKPGLILYGTIKSI